MLTRIVLMRPWSLAVKWGPHSVYEDQEAALITLAQHASQRLSDIESIEDEMDDIMGEVLAELNKLGKN